MKKLAAWTVLSTLILAVGCGQNNKSGGSTTLELPGENIHSELAVGSVVGVAGQSQKYLITTPNYEDASGQAWDYLVYNYPQGNQNAANVLNNGDIESIYYNSPSEINENQVIPFEKTETYLPLGTIVKVTGAPEPLMIYGRLQALEKTGEIYEYAACGYPEGLVNPEDTYLFNSGLIEGVYQMGYVSEEEEGYQYFLDEVSKQYSVQN